MNELYGSYNLATMEWADGVLSTIFRNCAQDEKVDEKWIMLDGPVDTLWIESMNTVMDDNKTLTLINGDRISMSNTMSLVFEVLTLEVASPATVSRAGMVYFDVEDLGWKPYVASWMIRMFGKDDDDNLVEFYNGLFEKYVPRLLEFKAKNCTDLVPISDFNCVIALCNLFSSLATPANGLDKAADPESYFSLAEKWFVYCITWSICGATNEKGRILLDECVRDIEAQFPPSNTIYEYFVEPKVKDFKQWEDRVPKGWRPPATPSSFRSSSPPSTRCAINSSSRPTSRPASPP